MGSQQIIGLFPMENIFGQGKDLFSFSFTVSLQHFSNKLYWSASEPKNIIIQKTLCTDVIKYPLFHSAYSPLVSQFMNTPTLFMQQ